GACQHLPWAHVLSTSARQPVYLKQPRLRPSELELRHELAGTRLVGHRRGVDGPEPGDELQTRLGACAVCAIRQLADRRCLRAHARRRARVVQVDPVEYVLELHAETQAHPFPDPELPADSQILHWAALPAEVIGVSRTSVL